MKPEPDITTFSAMFSQMAAQYARTRGRGARANVATGSDQPPVSGDELTIRAAMEQALERRRTLRRAEQTRHNRP